MSDNTPDTIQHLRKKHDAALEFGSERIDIGVYELTALLAQLDAKDTEIARIKSERDIYEQEYKQARTQIAERDATIAKMAKEYEELEEQADRWREESGN